MSYAAATTETSRNAASIAGAPAVTLRGVTVAYDGSPVLQGADLTLPWGCLVGVIGPNGAGKSTLIKTILGALRPLSGEVDVGGWPARTRQARNAVGYVPQRESVNWDFPVTVHDVVMMGRTGRLGWLRFPGPEDQRAVSDALDRVGMTEYAGRQISQLSGGQQQRVFLARALAQGGRLLLLDEPLNGVDATTQEAIGELLRREVKAGGTVVMATHDLELAAAWCDVLVMVNHAIVACGPPAEALTPDVLRQTYGGHLLVVPGQEGAEIAAPDTVVPDAHGTPGGQPEPGTQIRILK